MPGRNTLPSGRRTGRSLAHTQPPGDAHAIMARAESKRVAATFLVKNYATAPSGYGSPDTVRNPRMRRYKPPSKRR